MIELHIEKASINSDRLHADLKSALNDACFGISFSCGLVTVHLPDDATAKQQIDAEAIVAAHDPASLTPEQEAEEERRAIIASVKDDAQWGEMAVAEQMAALRKIVLGAV